MTRLDIPTISTLERAVEAQTDLERAVRLQRDTAEYAAGLKQQMDVLIAAYDAALKRWTEAHDLMEERLREERGLANAAVGKLETTTAYIEHLEGEVLTAWETLEQTETGLGKAIEEAAFYKNELTVVHRLSAEREKRLTISVHEAQLSEKTALAAAEAADREAKAALRRCEEFRAQAEWATDERARLAKCYEDACFQAQQIGTNLSDLERELGQTLAAKDAEVLALTQRCEELESTLLERINASIQEARAESERLGRLIHGVQQGRFWRLKRLVQRARNIVGG